ncbi:MAG: hypothetical protein FJY99_05880 [Candidatus Sericytochromatia bacterium]|nr:hypothetical protein [Candidatus Tanganyikabacteria bacterium]
MSRVRWLPVALGAWLLAAPPVRAAEVTSVAVGLPDLALLNQQQQAMTLTTGWGLASIGTGAALLARPTDAWTRAFATQQVVWGVIDAGIGLWAVQDFEKRRALPADPGHKPWLHDLYLVNAALDVGYMAAGLALMAQPDEQIKGHGAGVLLQGAWLALFDGANAWLTRPAP